MYYFQKNRLCVLLALAIGTPVTINKLFFKHYVLCIITAIAPANDFKTKQSRYFEIKHPKDNSFHIFTKLLGQFWLVAVYIIV